MMRPLIVPGIIAAFSVVIIYLALQLKLSPPMIVGHSMQPRSFPIFLMVINLVLVGIPGMGLHAQSAKADQT